MLISLTGYAFQYVYIQQNIKMLFISQCIHISKHHVCCINIHQNVIYNDVLIQCIQFLFVNYTLIKLKMQILPQVNIIVKFIVQTRSKSLHFSCKQKGSSNFIK